MDTTEKYILMCEKAEEVQKEWKPDIGDYIDPCGVVSVITSLYQPDDGFCLIGTNNVNFYGQMHPKSMYFWLPRPDQLWAMLDWGWAAIINGLYEFTTLEANYENFGSIEQCIFAFVMHEKYQKRWDEGKQEWK